MYQDLWQVDQLSSLPEIVEFQRCGTFSTKTGTVPSKPGQLAILLLGIRNRTVYEIWLLLSGGRDTFANISLKHGVLKHGVISTKELPDYK